MRRFFIPIGSFAALALFGCTSDSSFPTVSGKGTLRAVNAIPGSPEVAFLIEERVVGGAEYKSSTTGTRYDNLNYTFNFEARFAGESTRRRIGSRNLDVVADKDYTFVLSGSLAAPTITLWEGDERTWEGSETVFEARLAHTAASLGDVDVYFAAPGTAPLIGEQLGTLSFGEILPAAEFAEGDYVLTVTAAGDPTTVYFTSATNTFGARAVLILVAFDGDGNDSAPIIVRTISPMGGNSSIPDANFPPRLRFIHASMALETADIYDDPALASPIVTNHGFGDVTADLASAAGDLSLTYTAAGNSGAILFEGDTSLTTGTVNHYVVVGGTIDELTGIRFVPERRVVETFAKLQFMHAAANHDATDVYAVAADTDITDALPFFFSIGFGSAPIAAGLEAGSYDMYITPVGEKTVITGPVRLDVAPGDIVDTILYDTVDPATAELRFIPVP